jgi:carboxylesterase
MNIVQVDGRPFFLKRGKIGCMLLHGFTGVPKEMRWLGEQLAEENYSVLGIRLFGHGTDQKDLLRVRWQDWYLSVEDGYRVLRSYCDKVYLAGFSLGGILSLLFATKFPVDGVITYSTPLEFWRFFPKGEREWADNSLAIGHFEYPSYPIRAAYELHLVLKEMRASISQVNVPVLIVHSKSDRSVQAYQAQMIYDQLSHPEKSVFWLDESGHVVTADVEREKVAQATIEFIQRFSNPDTVL